VLELSGQVFAVTALAQCDGLPVDLALRDSEGVGIRLEFVPDLAELEAGGLGQWSSITEMVVGTTGAFAGSVKGQHLAYRCDCALSPGSYVAQAFRTAHDVLGLRIMLQQEASDLEVGHQ